MKHIISFFGILAIVLLVNLLLNVVGLGHKVVTLGTWTITWGFIAMMVTGLIGCKVAWGGK